ncbi:hypothetical protein KR038_001836 [Drosophila bunnanda]|nr:hypothetical protein KR038_001836 [Drosophila bunnanda]
MLKTIVLLVLAGTAIQVQSKRYTSVQIFGQVINDLPDDNINVCPPAIELALTQLYLAAGGATEAELKTSITLTGNSKGSVYENPFPSMASEENPRIRVAGRIYARKGVQIQKTYQSTHTKHLNTEIEYVDESDKWAEAINKWVTSQTKNGLEDLTDPLQLEDSRNVFLTNTVNFYGLWKQPFKPIANGLFYIPDERRWESVKMMQLVGSFKYTFETSIDCHTLILPFSKSKMDMVLLIPSTFDEIDRIEKGLKSVDVRKTEVRNVNLTLPQFKFRYTRDMIQTLIDLGVNETVFDDTNLSDLIHNNKKFNIDSMIQSTIIQVDAEGINAFSATGSIFA